MRDIDELKELYDEKINNLNELSAFISEYLNDYLKRQDENLRLLNEAHQKFEQDCSDLL